MEDYHTDEEPEMSENQAEDMKQYMNKLNKRIDRILSMVKQNQVDQQSEDYVSPEAIQAQIDMYYQQKALEARQAENVSSLNKKSKNISQDKS